ncbi:MAG: S-adenosylmethionine:tRNA ribosyltransferase-isomerase, partial [Rhizobacter sp.]|nr:S-adenosylmethionine:tRNA ribosyltransferase-isomerase [Chlorobiales bacterium]
AVQAWMTERRINVLTGETALLIAPDDTFHLCTGLITNFHQPYSTLILLVAAFLGAGGRDDLWRRVYDEALKENYRFLSYGDASLLWR